MCRWKSSPDLAHDTESTITQAMELHASVNRKNLMIKVPATPAGIPVITKLISEGICVNVNFDVLDRHVS